MKMWFRNRMDWLDREIGYLTGNSDDGGQSPITHPVGGLIQAEDFSAMEGIQVENTGDVGGGSNVGYISAGDWLEYTIDVSSAGSYLFEYRVASSGGTNGFEVLVDGVQVDSQNISDTAEIVTQDCQPPVSEML
jgi:glucan 1,3-beta-glucosidase